MNWCNIPINKLSEDELCLAIYSVAEMDRNRVDKLDQSRERHTKLFTKHPPTENPAFTEIVTELNNEFNRRWLTRI